MPVNPPSEPLRMFMCAICRKTYHSFLAADGCEAQGKAKEYPIGLMYGDHRPGSPWASQCFAVAQNNIREGSHHNFFDCWTTFDAHGKGDVLPPLKCAHYGIANRGRLSGQEGNLLYDHPAVKRMIWRLESAKIKPLVWLGNEIVDLDEWKRRNTAKGTTDESSLTKTA